MTKWDEGSGLTKSQWRTLAAVRDWSKRGVDPLRDLREAREEYPDLTVHSTVPPLSKSWQHWYTNAPNLSRPPTVLEASTRPLTARLYGYESKDWERVYRTAPMGAFTIAIVWFRTELVLPIVYDADRRPMDIHEHIVEGGVCLGQGQAGFEMARQEGRWADAFAIVERVIETFHSSNDLNLYVRRLAARRGWETRRVKEQSDE